MSAIKEAYIMFNGQKVVAQYDERTETWTATTNAPANSSWSQPDHVYKVEIHAVDAANNKATMTSANPTYGDQLKIRVLEKSKPTATIVSPTQGSVLGASEQDIVSIGKKHVLSSSFLSPDPLFQANRPETKLMPFCNTAWTSCCQKKSA